jgi:hypothetical protein
MSCDEILSEITGHPTGQAFSHVDEFCKPRLMNFDEIYDIINSGKIEFPIEIVILPLEEVRWLKKEKISREKMFDEKIEFHDKNLNSVVGIQIDEEKFIRTIFNQKCKIKNRFGSMFNTRSRSEKFEWISNNIYNKKFSIQIESILSRGKKIIYVVVNHDFTKRRKESVLIFSIYKDNDIVKFYDIGA